MPACSAALHGALPLGLGLGLVGAATEPLEVAEGVGATFGYGDDVVKLQALTIGFYLCFCSPCGLAYEG